MLLLFAHFPESLPRMGVDTQWARASFHLRIDFLIHGTYIHVVGLVPVFVMSCEGTVLPRFVVALRRLTEFLAPALAFSDNKTTSHFLRVKDRYSTLLTFKLTP